MELSINVNDINLIMVLFISTMFLMNFSLIHISVTERGVLKFPSVLVDLSTFSLSFI